MLERLFAARVSWWMLLIIAGCLLLASELGYRLGRRHREDSIEAKKSQTSTLVVALLGLLALLMAFSFSIVESRFGARKALVLEEANAIGTTYLRAQMLPAPHGERIQGLLQRYVNLRIAPRTPAEVQRAIEQSEALHRELWAEATAVAIASPRSEIASIFIQSLNQMIDLHESRVTVGLYQRLPMPILATVVLVSILAIGVLGFSSGLARWRSLLPTVALMVSIFSVLLLIVELDRPMGGLFHIHQNAMEDLEETLSSDRPGAVAPPAR